LRRIDSRLDTAKYAQTVTSTWTTPIRCSFWGDERRFHTAWVIFEQVIELSLRADVRFDPESDQDRAATQYVAMGQKQKSANPDSIGALARNRTKGDTKISRATRVRQLYREPAGSKRRDKPMPR